MFDRLNARVDCNTRSGVLEWVPPRQLRRDSTQAMELENVLCFA